MNKLKVRLNPYFTPVLVFSLVIFAGTFLFLKPNKVINTASSNGTPISPAQSAPQYSTDNWNKYTNNKLNIEFQYPPSYKLYESGGSINLNETRVSENYDIPIITIEPRGNRKATLSSDTLQIVDNLGYSDFYSENPVYVHGGNFLGDPPWGYYQIFFSTNPGTPKYVDYVFEARINRSDQLTFAEGGTEGEQLATVKQILSTFKFVDPRGVNSNIDTGTWKTVKFNGVEFKIPQTADCGQTNETTMNCGIKVTEAERLQHGDTFFIIVKDYKGGTLREQTTDDVGCKPKYINSVFGDVVVLEVPYDAEQCQGIDGQIITIVGKKLVTFTNHKYDPATGEVIKWDIRNKIISTLQETN